MARYFLAIILGLFAILACGGGGVGAPARFIYRSTWSPSPVGPDGRSQLIQLYDSSGALLFFARLEKPATSVGIPAVPDGTYHLHVELYDQPNTSGNLTGVLDDFVTVSGVTTYTSAVGIAPASVVVTPPSATMYVDQQKQFYATPKTAANVATFTAPNGFNWVVTNGVGTVDNTGLVTSTNGGSGQVQATQQASSILGSSSLTVHPVTHTKWTVIVYMNAANDLWSDSVTNMNQMEMAASNPEVRFVVQWKQSTVAQPGSTFNGTRRYLVEPDNTNAIASDLIEDMGTNVDMGSATTMQTFIDWAKAHFPADRYCVIVWNHGNGWRATPFTQVHSYGVSYDDQSGNHIDTWQLNQAFGSGVNDIVAWDASLMQQLEVDDEIRDKALYIVGSEESPPAAGYPYHTIFAHFRDNPDDTTLNLAKWFVTETVATYGSSFKITQSVVDASQLQNLGNSVSSLGDALIANQGSALTPIVQTTRNTSQRYLAGLRDEDYRDLFDVCDHLINLGAPAAVQTQAAAVEAALQLAVVYEAHNSNSPGSHGISIDFSSAGDFGTNSHAAQYANLRLAQETHWDEWLTVAP